METIKPGKFVSLGYDLYRVDEGGKETIVHQIDRDDPENIIFGVTQYVIEDFEHAIEGLKVGDKFNILLAPEKAFGMPDPDKVLTLNKAIFNVDGKFDEEHIKVNELVPMMTAEGFHVTGMVKAVNDDSVVMDFNHPLAGKTVRFKGEIYEVRDATPEELMPAQHGCGCGCHDHGCGDGCDCEDGCEGGHCHGEGEHHHHHAHKGHEQEHRGDAKHGHHGHFDH